MSTIARTIAQYSALFRGREGQAAALPRAPSASRSSTVARRPRLAARPAPRVLILSASAGVGHLRAAEAIELALREEYPDAHVVNRDVLSLTNSAFRYFYGSAYFDLIARVPHLIGYLYDRLDRQSRGRRLKQLSFRAQRSMHLGRVVELIESHPWDLVINTHFIGAQIVASLKDEGRTDAVQVTATTDFYVHQMWVTDHIERYFAASEEAAVNLSPRVADSGVSVTGIPIHPAFSRPLDRMACRERHSLPLDRPVVLQLAGGLGIGPMEQVHRAILDSKRPLHVVVATGKNASRKSAVERIPLPPQHQRTVLGFTTQMHELLSAADAVVSKPGGLTTSESLATGTPMVVIDPIPGQEQRNSDYLLEHGAAVKVNSLASLGYKLDGLLGDRDRLAMMRIAARRLGRPRAAYDVAREALALCQS